MNDILPGVEVTADRSTTMQVCQVKIRNGFTTDFVESTNIGFGISYALPIVIQGLIAKKWVSHSRRFRTMIKKLLLVLLVIIAFVLAWKILKVGLSILGTIAVLCLVVWIIKNVFWSKK